MVLKFGLSNIHRGTGGDDTLYGFNFDEIFYGYGGNDTFVSSGGADTYFGGDGRDTVDYSNSAGGVTALLYKGTSGYGKNGFAEGDTFHSIENLKGSLFDDELVGDELSNMLWGLNGHDNLSGLDGNDIIYGGDGIDRIYGGNNNDNLFGGRHADYVFGGNGNDKVFGGDGADYLRGGSGDDVIYGDTGDNQIFGDGGQDTLFGGDETDTVFGGSGNDGINAGDGNDFLYGGLGDDKLSGGAGADVIDGGDGIDWANYGNYNGITVDLTSGTGTGSIADGDTLLNIENVSVLGDQSFVYGDDGDNRFFNGGYHNHFEGRDGNDTFVNGPAGTGIDEIDTIDAIPQFTSLYDGGDGVDTVEYSGGVQVATDPGYEIDLDAGTARNLADAGLLPDRLISIENVTGSSLADTIFGDDANNILRGEGGDDYLIGRDGDDTLVGGLGADIFAFDIGRFDNIDDTVQDFQIGTDKLDFSQVNRIDDFADFQDRSEQVGADVVIDTGSGSITLENTVLAYIAEGDLMF